MFRVKLPDMNAVMEVVMVLWTIAKMLVALKVSDKPFISF